MWDKSDAGAENSSAVLISFPNNAWHWSRTRSNSRGDGHERMTNNLDWNIAFTGSGFLVHHTMFLCFGSRRRARHLIQWNERDFLLDDEPQAIPNPCFLETGKGHHCELWQLNTWSNCILLKILKGNITSLMAHGHLWLLCVLNAKHWVFLKNTLAVFWVTLVSLLIENKREKMHQECLTVSLSTQAVHDLTWQSLHSVKLMSEACFSLSYRKQSMLFLLQRLGCFYGKMFFYAQAALMLWTAASCFTVSWISQSDTIMVILDFPEWLCCCFY